MLPPKHQVLFLLFLENMLDTVKYFEKNTNILFIDMSFM